MEHTQECLDTHRRAEEARTAWGAKWPNYCRGCEGHGGSGGSYDPIGDGRGHLSMFDPCSTCAENGICARCGTKEAEEGALCETPCTVCGWDQAKPDGMPQLPDGPCPCYERELDESFREADRMFWERFDSEHDPSNEDYIRHQSALEE